MRSRSLEACDTAPRTPEDPLPPRDFELRGGTVASTIGVAFPNSSSSSSESGDSCCCCSWTGGRVAPGATGSAWTTGGEAGNAGSPSGNGAASFGGGGGVRVDGETRHVRAECRYQYAVLYVVRPRFRGGEKGVE